MVLSRLLLLLGNIFSIPFSTISKTATGCLRGAMQGSSVVSSSASWGVKDPVWNCRVLRGRALSGCLTKWRLRFSSCCSVTEDVLLGPGCIPPFLLPQTVLLWHLSPQIPPRTKLCSFFIPTGTLFIQSKPKGFSGHLLRDKLIFFPIICIYELLKTNYISLLIIKD